MLAYHNPGALKSLAAYTGAWNGGMHGALFNVASECHLYWCGHCFPPLYLPPPVFLLPLTLKLRTRAWPALSKTIHLPFYCCICSLDVLCTCCALTAPFLFIYSRCTFYSLLKELSKCVFPIAGFVSMDKVCWHFICWPKLSWIIHECMKHIKKCPRFGTHLCIEGGGLYFYRSILLTELMYLWAPV